jgi:DNA-binding NarL/FixJ family response regulator
MSTLKILIADDHDVMRRGIKEVLRNERWEVRAEARDGAEAIAKCEETRPDVAVVDFQMPIVNGLDVAKRIKTASPSTKVVMLTVDSSDELISQALNVGARAFLHKSECGTELTKAIEAVGRGKSYLSQCALELVVVSRTRPGAMRLTGREREVVTLITEGKTNREVARSLGMSEKTADSHRLNIMKKLRIHNKAELVRWALRNRIAG